MRQSLPADSCVASELERLRSDAEELTLNVRQISHNLHHPQLALGLRHGAASFCREFSEQYGIAVELTHEGDLEHAPAMASLVLFRILQEALNNVAKHSGADRVSIFFSVEGDRVLLHVRDCRRGFEIESIQNQGGLGLVSMRERLQLVGGTMTVTSSPGRGAHIEAVVPLTVAERPASAAA